MVYDEDNIIGVEFIILDIKHIILENPKISSKVYIAKSENIHGSRGDWDKSVVKRYLNDGKCWKPVINSPIYEIY